MLLASKGTPDVLQELTRVSAKVSSIDKNDSPQCQGLEFQVKNKRVLKCHDKFEIFILYCKRFPLYIREHW